MLSKAAAPEDVSVIVEKFLRWELAFINEGLARIKYFENLQSSCLRKVFRTAKGVGISSCGDGHD